MTSSKMRMDQVEHEDSEPDLCSICLAHFEKPKALSCIHTFCLDCLTDWARTTSSCPAFLPGSKFLCPVCRTVNIIPADGIKGFPTNIYVKSGPAEASEHRRFSEVLSGNLSTTVQPTYFKLAPIHVAEINSTTAKNKKKCYMTDLEFMSGGNLVGVDHPNSVVKIINLTKKSITKEFNPLVSDPPVRVSAFPGDEEHLIVAYDVTDQSPWLKWNIKTNSISKVIKSMSLQPKLRFTSGLTWAKKGQDLVLVDSDYGYKMNYMHIISSTGHIVENFQIPETACYMAGNPHRSCMAIVKDRNSIYAIDTDGNIMWDTSMAGKKKIGWCVGMCMTASGFVIAADCAADALHVFSPVGEFLESLFLVKEPYAVAYDDDQSLLAVFETYRGKIHLFYYKPYSGS